MSSLDKAIRNPGILALIMFLVGFGIFTLQLVGNKADPAVVKSALQTMFTCGVGTVSLILMRALWPQAWRRGEKEGPEVND